MIPPEFTGGWLRTSISMDGGAPAEDMLVWWLQAPSRHADLRVPLAGGGAVPSDITAFAGTTVYDAPSLTWVPDLELVPSGFPDTGVVRWDGDDLLEAGTFDMDGRDVPYLERWQRIPGTDGPLVALSRPNGYIVQAGSRALSIVDDRATGGAFNAVAWRLVDGGWVVDHCWPPDASAPPPPALALALAMSPTVVLADGQEWTVDEVSTREDSRV